MILREIQEEDRNEAIQLVNQFFRQVNQMPLDGLFHIRPRAGAKFTDIYLKLLGTGKVYFRGIWEGESLVSLLVGRVEEKPHLVEERSFFIDLAVTKKGHQRKGHMKSLLADLELWCQSKSLPSIELRVLLGNQPALDFWNRTDYQPFYLRYRKKIS